MDATLAVTGIQRNYDAGASWTAVHTVTNSSDMQSAADVSGAPDSGQYLVVTDVIISTDTALTITLQEETSATVFGGPYYLAANSTLQLTIRSRQFKLATANKKLQAVASKAGNVTIETWAFSEA